MSDSTEEVKAADTPVVKRGRGRPKGSKNKPKAPAPEIIETAKPKEEQLTESVPVVVIVPKGQAEENNATVEGE